MAAREEPRLTPEPIDFDSPWKEALEEYLPDFFALFFPAMHAEIDWTRPHAFLDKELQQAVREAELGRRLVDKLVRVWRRDGVDAWVLLHIEVQSQEERAFARRMFVYFYRLYDRFGRQVVSLAVLADERENWRPSRYTLDLWGCTMRFSYPIVKLRDYRTRRAELEASDNPFATVVLAHLAAQDTRGDVQRRRQVKAALTRRLYEWGYSRERILGLFRFIDWLLELPADLEAAFWQEMQAFEEERRMPYITSVERLGIKKGLEQGIAQGREQGIAQGREQGIAQGRDEGTREALRRIVRARFQHMPNALEQRIATADHDTLDQMLDRVSTIQSADDL